LVAFRSKDFSILLDILRFKYKDAAERTHLVSMFQQLWTRCDPGGFISYVSGQKNTFNGGAVTPTLPKTPKHALLFQDGLGDLQVGNITNIKSLIPKSNTQMSD
jgi:hypothetical protein